MPIIRSPDHWSARAEETRVLAELMKDERARAAMLVIAVNYEKLAEMTRAAPGIVDPE